MIFRFVQRKIALSIIFITIVFVGVEAYILTNEKEKILFYAKESFKRAVDIDLNKRWKNAGFREKYVMEAHAMDSVTYPLQIRGVSENGEYIISISERKDLQNINPIQTEYAKRIMQTILGDISDTIQLDTLKFIWNAELRKEVGIEYPLALRMDCYSISRPYTFMTSDTLTRPLSFYYIGSRFENSIRSYIQVSYLALFIRSLSSKNMLVLIAYAFSIFLLFYVRWYSIRQKHIQAAKLKKTLTEAEIKSKEEIQRAIKEIKRKRIEFEKERMRDESVHYFAEDIFWNKETYVLSVHGEEKKLRSQLGILFTLFIESEDYEITSQQIMDKIWQDGSGSFEKCRRLIYDLRHAIPDKYFHIRKGNQGNSNLYFTESLDD